MVALKTGKPVRNEMMGVFHPQESRYHWIIINAIPQFKPGEDTPYQVYTTFSDITERKRAEEEIQNLAKFPSENPNPVLRIARDKTVLYANGAAEAILSEDNVKAGHHISGLWPQWTDEVLKLGVVRTDIETRHGDRVFSWTMTPVIDKDYLNVYGIDITERKRGEEALRQSEERFRQFFESAPEYCYMISPDGIMLDVNNAALKVLGYKKNELVGKQLKTIYAPESLPKMKELFQKWKATGELKDEEMVIITNKGDRRTVLLSAGVVKDKDGGKQCSVSVQKDITERKRSEEEIRKKNEELEAFVYMVSHDLKNPVVSIQGFCSSILKNQRDELNEKTLFYLQRVQANASLMASLLEDLVELSRIGRIEDKKTEISVQEVIKSVWAGVSTSLATQDVEFVCPENLPQVVYPEKRLYQIFSNLLSNAVKFKSENKIPQVEIGYQENKGNYTFFVRDNGIGIEQKYHNKIFDVFSQLRETESEGTGMGLAIVKKIVEANLGKVWVESQKGAGSTFYFTIPKKV
jgi:PAS domain S-box-containing protein